MLTLALVLLAAVLFWKGATSTKPRFGLLMRRLAAQRLHDERLYGQCVRAADVQTPRSVTFPEAHAFSAN